MDCGVRKPFTASHIAAGGSFEREILDSEYRVRGHPGDSIADLISFLLSPGNSDREISCRMAQARPSPAHDCSSSSILRLSAFH